MANINGWSTNTPTWRIVHDPLPYDEGGFRPQSDYEFGSRDVQAMLKRAVLTEGTILEQRTLAAPKQFEVRRGRGVAQVLVERKS